jgi:hypothetical protein
MDLHDAGCLVLRREAVVESLVPPDTKPWSPVGGTAQYSSNKNFTTVLILHPQDQE